MSKSKGGIPDWVLAIIGVIILGVICSQIRLK